MTTDNSILENTSVRNYLVDSISEFDTQVLRESYKLKATNTISTWLIKLVH